MKAVNKIGQHWDLECSLAGHKMVLNFGPECLERFTEKMGMPIADVISRINAVDMDIVTSAPKTLIHCAIKPRPAGGPTEADLDRWAKEDPLGLLNILMSFVGVLKEQYQFTNKSN